MRHLFYAMVEMITERITGIESDAMTLWEFPTYVHMSRDVTIVSNIVIAIMIPVVIVGVYTMIEFFGKLFKKICSHSKEKNPA